MHVLGNLFGMSPKALPDVARGDTEERRMPPADFGVRDATSVMSFNSAPAAAGKAIAPLSYILGRG